MLQKLPNLESLEFSAAVERFCDHSHSNSRFTLGVKRFVFSKLLPSCASFLGCIDLSPKCRWSSITCHSHAKFELEISEVTRIRFHNLDRFRPFGTGHFLVQVIQAVTTEYSSHFSVHVHRHGEDSTHDVHDRSFFFTALLDLIWHISTCVELAEIHCHQTFSDGHWDHLSKFLIPCRNLRFMGNVSRPWWERLYKCLIPAAGEVINDATEPLWPRLQTIDFDCSTGFKEKFPWGDAISFDELKVFCKHRARIRVPLPRICFTFDGVFEIDSFGEIKSELESSDTGKRA